MINGDDCTVVVATAGHPLPGGNGGGGARVPSQALATDARGDVVVRVVREPVELYVVGLVDQQLVKQPH